MSNLIDYLYHTRKASICMSYMVGKILMVDDDIDDYGFLREALSRIDSKIECHHAGDGEHAFKALQANELGTPDMILLDINMPKWDGKKFLKAVREKELMRHVPVNIFSTYVSEDDKETFGKMGVYGFYNKPNTMHELVDMLKTMLVQTTHHLQRNLVFKQGKLYSEMPGAGGGYASFGYRADL